MIRSITAVALLAFVAPAMADGPSYNYVEGRYQRIDIDDSFADVDGDGFGIAGSFEVGDVWHLFASFDSAELDFDVDVDELLIGGGFHTALSENLDFVAELAYARFDASTQGFSFDDDGYSASLGLRGLAADRIELAAFVDYVDLDSINDDTSVRGEAWYKFTDSVAIGFEVGAGDDVTTYGIGARVYFD